MIIKVACVCICVCLLSVLLSQYTKSFVLPLQLCFGVIVLLIIFNEVKDSVSDILSLIDFDDKANKIFSCLLKGALICVLTKLTSDVSKDSGNNFVSSVVEIAGRIMLLVVTLPFLESVIKTALSFVK